MLQFTERGQITFEVNSRRLSNSDEYEITLLVRDTGIGIRGAYPPPVSSFQPGRHLRHPSPQRQQLGLVIVKKLCELMGGTTTVDTRYGHGSTFIATLRGRSARPPSGLQTPSFRKPWQMYLSVFWSRRIISSIAG